MATFQKRGQVWRAIVRKYGKYASDSFATKAQAQAWALAKELEICADRRGDIPEGKVFLDLIDRFLLDHNVDKPTRLRMLRVAKSELAEVSLSVISGKHVAEWRDARLKEVSVASVLREWNTLSSICTQAVKEWRWLKTNPFREATRPETPPSRTRRVEGDELERILYCLGYEEGVLCTTLTSQAGAAAVFAVETGMRAGEICGLRPVDIVDGLATLRDTKNGDTRKVPLTRRAQAVLQQLPGGFFHISPATLDALWRKGRDRALVKDLRFHDLRREALTRMAKKLDVMTLAKISGHRDLKILLNTYYAPRMEEVSLD